MPGQKIKVQQKSIKLTHRARD